MTGANTLLPKLKTNTLRLFTRLGLVCGGISVLWLIYNSYVVFTIHEWVQTPRYVFNEVFLGFFFNFLTHFFFFALIITVIRSIQSARMIGILTAVLWALSVPMFLGDCAAMIDIVREYQMGIQGELNGLYAGLTLHYLFYVCFFLMIARVFGALGTNGLKPSTALGENIL